MMSKTNVQNRRAAATLADWLSRVVVSGGDHPANKPVRRGRARILIVEDDVNLADNLAEIVALAGYDAIVVHSAEQALAVVERGSVDIIITDNRLSGMSGAGLLSKLRAGGVHLPAVLMTAAFDASVEAALEETGALFAAKPLDIPTLMTVLDALRAQP